jgi:hypothetical protein
LGVVTLACTSCNQKKGNQTASEFGHPDIQRKAKLPLKDAAAMNTTRWVLFNGFESSGFPLETGTGARTKYNRRKQAYPRAHWIDAACVGESGERVYIAPGHAPLLIKATGHGRRQRCCPDKYGVPKAHAPAAKSFLRFQTGDIVKAVIPNGKYTGTHTGRLVIRYRPSCRLNGIDVHPKYLSILHQADGYSYEKGERYSSPR